MSKLLKKLISCIIIPVYICTCLPFGAMAYGESDTVIIDKTDNFSRSDVQKASTFEKCYGIAGKSDTDECMLVTGSENDLFVLSGAFELDVSKVYIFEVSLLAVDKIKSIFFGTRYHTNVSQRIDTSRIVPYSWNKLQYVYRPGLGIGNMYVNGVDTGATNIDSTIQKYIFDEKQGFRFILDGSAGISAYLDNIRFYITDEDEYDVFSDIKLTDSSPLHIDNNIAYIPDGFTANELNSAISAENLQFVNLFDDGKKLALTDINDITKSFDVKVWEEDMVFTYGDGFSVFGTCIPGKLYSKKLGYKGDVYAICQYDKNSRLIGVDYNVLDGDRVVTATYDVIESDGGFVKVLSFGANLHPKSDAVEYDYGIPDVKSASYAPKSAESIIEDENFDIYEGTGIGNGMVISKSNTQVSVVDDAWCGGKYLRINKTKENGTANIKKFFEPNGGNLRLDFQLALFSDDVYASFKTNGFNYYSDDSLCSYISIDGSELSIVDSYGKTIPVTELKLDDWYDISLFYNADMLSYDLYIDGSCVKRNVAYKVRNRTVECFDINVISEGMCDLGIDNIRMSYTEYGEWGVTDIPSDNIYENDFDDIEEDSLIVDDVAGDIYHKKDGDNGYVEANRVSENGTCSKHYNFEPTYKDVVMECDIYLADAGGATKLISLVGDTRATVYFSGYNMYVLGRTGRPLIKKSIEIGVWHKLKFVTDMANSSFAVYLDDECLKQSAEFEGLNPSQFNLIRFAITAGGASSFRMDNVKITRSKGTVEYVPELIDTYKPDASAPKSYDWQSIYTESPKGIVYEAEDMNLTNYAKIYDDMYNDGCAVETYNDGFGMAEFTFNGESGYYEINIGYAETTFKTDSFYELEKNDKRLDWWIGQFDDGVSHIRQSKRYTYINKGDRFRIIGNGFNDPAILDYVEFVKTDKIDEFTYGDLTEDDKCHPDTWLSSSWDAVEDGGYARYDLKLYDVRDDAHCELIRNIYPFYKSFNLDYTLNVNTSKDSSVRIGDGTTFPISYKFGDKAITVGGVTYKEAFKNTSEYKYRIAVDAESKTFTLVVNGTPLAKDVPFDGDVDEFSQVRFESSDKGNADFSVYYVKLSAGYDMYETFRPYVVGSVPYDWNMTSSTVQDIPSEGADRRSLRMSANGSSNKTFDAISEKITYESFFMLPTKKDGVKLQLGSGCDYIGFYTKDGHIYYDTDIGEDKLLWENYKANIWYTLRIELDTEIGKANFYVNDFCKAENINVSLKSVDNVNFVSGSGDGYLWVDDVSVVNYIYETTVPEPQVPELKDDYTIVMETCDLWREGNHFGWDSLVPFDNRTPLLGYLEDGNVEVADWETKFMAEHGITTYVPCWYRNAGYNATPIKDPRNSAKLHAFLKSDYCEYLNFAILLTDLSDTGGIEGFLDNFVNYWIERYFKAPNYWKIDNKPVIPAFATYGIVNINSSEYSYVFDKIEERLKENGFDGAVFIGLHGTKADYGYDYKYQYHQGEVLDGTTVIKNLLNGQSKDGIGFIASPSQGWGNEAWGRASRKYNVPLDQWYGSLEWIRDRYMPSQTDKVTSKTLWLGNWNEYSEGHSLAPSRLAGFGYLDGVRKVFTNGDTNHYDELPDKHYDFMTSALW